MQCHDELLMCSFECCFGVYFPYFVTTLSWAHKQFTIQVHTVFSISYIMQLNWIHEAFRQCKLPCATQGNIYARLVASSVSIFCTLSAQTLFYRAHALLAYSIVWYVFWIRWTMSPWPWYPCLLELSEYKQSSDYDTLKYRCYTSEL